MTRLCPNHSDQHDAWLYARPQVRPALVQIGGTSKAAALRQVLESRRMRAEEHAALVRRYLSDIERWCAEGRNCGDTLCVCGHIDTAHKEGPCVSHYCDCVHYRRTP